MDNNYREKLRKTLNEFSDNGLYEAIECLEDDDKTDSLLAVQERISDLETAVCIVLSELEGAYGDE